ARTVRGQRRHRRPDGPREGAPQPEAARLRPAPRRRRGRRRPHVGSSLMTQMSMLQMVPAPERAWRMLTIAADLLPVEVVETRRARKTRRSVVAAIIVLVVALAGWYAYAVYQTSQAQAQLDSAQSDLQRLRSKQA